MLSARAMAAGVLGVSKRRVQIPRCAMHLPSRQRDFKPIEDCESIVNALHGGVVILRSDGCPGLHVPGVGLHIRFCRRERCLQKSIRLSTGTRNVAYV